MVGKRITDKRSQYSMTLLLFVAVSLPQARRGASAVPCDAFL
jgi:hypothetical protein